MTDFGLASPFAAKFNQVQERASSVYTLEALAYSNFSRNEITKRARAIGLVAATTNAIRNRHLEEVSGLHDTFLPKVPVPDVHEVVKRVAQSNETVAHFAGLFALRTLQGRPTFARQIVKISELPNSATSPISYQLENKAYLQESYDTTPGKGRRPLEPTTKFAAALMTNRDWQDAILLLDYKRVHNITLTEAKAEIASSAIRGEPITFPAEDELPLW